MFAMVTCLKTISVNVTILEVENEKLGHNDVGAFLPEIGV